MDKKIIFIDIDGTLFDHDTNSIPESSIKAINKAHSNGHKLFLCTGRAKTELEEQYKSLPFDGYVLSCGAQVVIDDCIIYCNPFPQEELKELTNFMLKKNIGFCLDGKERSYLSEYAYHIFSTVIFATPDNNTEMSRLLLTQNKMYPLHKITQEDYKQILKISLFSPEIEACFELIDNLPDTLSGFLHPSKNFNIMNGEISQKNTNKATGMDIVLKHLKFDIKNTIAIGDSLNDLEMLEHANVGICMGNGVQELKEKADFITKNINDDGLEYAFKHYGII